MNNATDTIYNLAYQTILRLERDQIDALYSKASDEKRIQKIVALYECKNRIYATMEPLNLKLLLKRILEAEEELNIK